MTKQAGSAPIKTQFIDPESEQGRERVPISSVVLSSQRVDLKAALFNAVKNKDRAEVTNPLVENGYKLIPSVTRVFHQNSELYIYLQAYEQDAQTRRPLVAFVSFYRTQAMAFETPPVRVSDGLDNRLRTTPLEFSVPLSGLAPGKYDCQVTVLDPGGQKAAFWQAPVMVVQ